MGKDFCLAKHVSRLFCRENMFENRVLIFGHTRISVS